MEIFKLGNAVVVCESKSTRNGFKHEATLLINGCEHETAKCMYQNRTWESYRFQTVLHKVLEKATVLSADKIRRFKKKYANSY